MARGFKIHSSAVFNPFSYQELMAPLQEYQQRYDAMQDSLLMASEEANQWQQYINADEAAGRTLQEYNDTLNSLTDNLSKNGLRSVNRNTLLGLRKTYNEKVKPINDAAKTLAGMYETYRQALTKDQTLMRGAMPSVSDLVSNPGATPVMVSGTDLYKQGAQVAQSASSRIFNTEFGRRVAGYIEQMQSRGYSPEQISRFIANSEDVEGIPELNRIMHGIAEMSGSNQLEDPQRARQYILQGMIDGLVRSEKTSYVQDWQSQLATQYQNQLNRINAQKDAQIAVLREKAKQKGAAGGGAGTPYGQKLSGLYIKGKDGKPQYFSTPAELQEMKNKNEKGIFKARGAGKTVSMYDLSPKEKVIALKRLNLIKDMDEIIQDDTGEIDENKLNELVDMYSDILGSYEYYSSGEDVKDKNYEFAMIPSTTQRLPNYDDVSDILSLLGTSLVNDDFTSVDLPDEYNE